MNKKKNNLKKSIEQEKEVLKNEVLVQNKKFSIKRFGNSFLNSVHGIAHAYLNEQSLSIVLFFTILLIPLGFIVKLNRIEWVLVILHLGLLSILELLNTSIEAVVDKASPEIHPLAKISKDTASGAEFFMSFITIINFAIIYIPKIIALFK